MRGVLVLRILARARMAVLRNCTPARTLRRSVIRRGTRISVFGWAMGQDAATHNCRTARASDVCPRPEMSLAWREAKEIDEAKKNDSLCR